MRQVLRSKILILILLLLLPFAAQAQAEYDAQPAPATYSPQQLDQLTAPIALYPDQLMGQILMASTYPLEVVQANRWLQTNGNGQLTGGQLQAALDQQPWDPSVKSLVAFPQVLSMMDKNLQWTEQLGNAFLADQASVMDSVQRLRSQAMSAGNLQSTPQQTVTGQPGELVIEPANPQVVYVPTYNPQVVYGAWAYPAYPPYYFPPPPGYIYTDVGPFAFFATGVILADWFWGWDNWDWYHHRIDIDDRRWEGLNRGRAPSFSGGAWEHDPSHRHGVPYSSPAVRSQFQQVPDEARRSSRGYAPRAGTSVAGPANNQMAPATHNFQQPLQQRSVTGGRTNLNPVRPTQEPVIQQERSNRVQPQVQTQPQTQRTSPVFESFSHGPEVRAQSQRGAYSRSSPVNTQRSAPAARQQAPSVSQAAPAAAGGQRRGGNAPQPNGGQQRNDNQQRGGGDGRDRDHNR